MLMELWVGKVGWSMKEAIWYMGWGVWVWMGMGVLDSQPAVVDLCCCLFLHKRGNSGLGYI